MTADKIITIAVAVIYIICLNISGCALEKDSQNVEHKEKSVILKLPQGRIKGLIKVTQHNSVYESYEGIPYAKPPVKELRFKDPLPAESWEDIYDATKPKSACTQRSGNEIVGSENCLFLNVYVPVKNEQNHSYPVMVYIHGGGFLEGSSNKLTDPELLIDQNVALVTLNYRLGPLGFMSLDTEDVPGNAGMRDQVEALRWIQKNIEILGGNPNCVTLFGESAGGVSVLLHQISEMSSGLYHRVISISGSSLCDWALLETHSRVNNDLFKILQLENNNRLNQLQQIPAAKIIEAGEAVEDLVSGDFYKFPFRPIVEKTFQNKESFLKMSPSDYYNKGTFGHVPTLLGYASKEFAASYNTSLLPKSMENPLFILPQKWLGIGNNETLKKAVEAIKEFYFGHEGIDYNDREKLISAVDLSSDLGFLKPVTEVTNILSTKSTGPVFLYRFSYRGGLNDPAIDQFGLQGAAHGDEIMYIFPTEKPRVIESSSDGWVRRRLIKLYTNFAKNGDPNPKKDDHLLPIKWLPVTSASLDYLEISGELTTSKNPDFRRAEFWRNLDKFVMSGSDAEDN